MAFSLATIKKAQKRRRVQAPALPPLGSFDPSILMTYGQNRRTADNVQSQYDLGRAQGEDDLGINLQRLDQQSQQALGDIVTGRTRTQEDYGTRTADLKQNYADLAARQGEGALRGNVESKGLLAQSLARRMANRQHDQSGLDTALSRSMADSTTAEQRTKQATEQQRADLALGFSRLWGSGSKGNPLGTNTLNLTQQKGDALSGNLDLSAVAFGQAAANGYVIPRRKKRTVIV